MAQGHDESSAYAICTTSLEKAGEPIYASDATVGGIAVSTLQAMGEALAQMRIALADWNEGDHPRGPDGKFASAGDQTHSESSTKEPLPHHQGEPLPKTSAQIAAESAALDDDYDKFGVEPGKPVDMLVEHRYQDLKVKTGDPDPASGEFHPPKRVPSNVGRAKAAEQRKKDEYNYGKRPQKPVGGPQLV